MDPKQAIGGLRTALYFGWPRLVDGVSKSLVARSLKAELFSALENNYLQSLGPIYFGIEARACWPASCLLDMLGILKRADLLPMCTQKVEVTLEIAADDVRKYDYELLALAGITRVNLVADCSSWKALEALGGGVRYGDIFREYGFSVAVELRRVPGVIFTEVVHKVSGYCTHVTVWPACEDDTRGIHDELVRNGFSSYARFHYEHGNHESEYMKYLWSQKNIVGLGAGAESVRGMSRKINSSSIIAYCSSKFDLLCPKYWQKISRRSFINEYIMLNAGTRSGVLFEKCVRFMTVAEFSRFRQRILGICNQVDVWITDVAFGVSSHSESVFQDNVANLFV